MAFITAVVGIVDSSLNNIAPLNTDGTRYPVLLKIGDNLVGTGSTSGGFAVVTLDAVGLGAGTAGDDEHGARGYQTTAAALLHPLATPSAPGFMSAADKLKLDSILRWTRVDVSSTGGPASHVADIGEWIVAILGASDDVDIDLPEIDAGLDGGEIRVHVAGGLANCNINAFASDGILNPAGIYVPTLTHTANSTLTVQAVYDPGNALGWGGSVWIIVAGAPVAVIT